VLVDFDREGHGHGHHHEHKDFISNHFHDPGTDRTFRIDPTQRARGGIFTERGTRVLSPSAQRGAQSILRRSPGWGHPGTYSQFRGYGVSRPSPGTRSGAFERWGDRRFEGAASTRGFQSRSRAGQLPARGAVPGRTPSGGGSRGGGGYQGFHGGGGGYQGFHGGGGLRR
jgi:hypothetical protein